MDRVLLPENTVERGRRLKSKRKHVVERGRRLKSERKHPNHVEGDLVDAVKSMADRKKQIRIAWADFIKRSRNLSEFDAIDPPAILELDGGIRTVDINEYRPLLTGLCEIALNNYNHCNNQDPKFEFHDLVKSTGSLPGMYFITFEAKKQDASPTIFQAKVRKKIKGPTEVMFCAIKKD